MSRRTITSITATRGCSDPSRSHVLCPEEYHEPHLTVIRLAATSNIQKNNMFTTASYSDPPRSQSHVQKNNMFTTASYSDPPRSQSHVQKNNMLHNRILQ
ncbi:hypothetical protein PoB_003506600 [Plakobranchus ocellatus]|uniref:Uncharacterized protein n=1 Tax=Plakobranchus ocellatus TaxID=259542 RepID=A0AAV4ABP4_9GAST|nr:hypothetical protein PoB_003506600 [Plakobranchus ocellatus]